MGPVLTDRPRWDPPLDRTSVGKGVPRVPGPPHGRGGPSTGVGGVHAPGGGPGRSNTHPPLALLCPDRGLRPRLEVLWMPWGSPPGWNHCHYQDPGGFLWITARRQRHVPGGPLYTSGRRPPLWLTDDAMQEDEQQRRWTKPLLPGTYFPPVRCRRFPRSSGRERRQVLQTTLPFAG